MKKCRIQCFSTPALAAAKAHPRNHYGWMLNGAELFEQFESTHQLFHGNADPSEYPVCFETFPHAVACALSGKLVSAKQKASKRRDLLRRAGLDVATLSNIDMVDAALCALTARYLAAGSVKVYGESDSGLIVVPGTPIISG